MHVTPVAVEGWQVLPLTESQQLLAHSMLVVQLPPFGTDPEVVDWQVPPAHVPDAHSTFAQQAVVVSLIFCVHCEGPLKQVSLKLQKRFELQSESVAQGCETAPGASPPVPPPKEIVLLACRPKPACAVATSAKLPFCVPSWN
jgi:hypothetical protein